MKRLLVLLLALLFSHSVLALEADEYLSADEVVSYEQADVFLKAMGFEDYADRAQETLDANAGYTKIAKVALEKNVVEFAALKSARILGNLAYASLVKAKGAPDFKNKFALLKALTAQQLTLFPLISSEKVLVDDKITDAYDRLDIQRKEYFKKADARYLKQVQTIVKSFYYLIDRKDDNEDVVNWLDVQTSNAIIGSYTKHSKQQTKYLGRALITVLVKFARENSDIPGLEDQIREELEKNNLHIENFILPVHWLKNSEHKLIKFDLKSGDMAYEYSHGDEAFFTSLVVRPSSSADKELAKKYDLFGSYTDATKFTGKGTAYITTVNKINTGLKITPEEKKIYDNFWNAKFAKGFSHSGLVEVRTDEKTKISIVWIWDIFPLETDDRIGTMRLLNPESFSVVEHHLKVAYSRHSPKKLLQEYKRQLKTRGYKKIIWESYASFYGVYNDGSGEGPVVDNDHIWSWFTRIDQETYTSWADVKEEDASEWYNKVILPRVYDRVKSYVYSNDAKIFADGLLSAQDMVYCSQMMVMAFLEGTNIDIQPNHDTVPGILTYINNKLKFFDTRGLDFRLVSPNGLIWQSQLTEWFDQVILDQDASMLNEKNKGLMEQKLNDYTKYLDNFDEIQGIKTEHEFYRLDEKSFDVIDYKV